MAESKAVAVKDDVFALAAKHDEALEKIEDAVDACQLYCEDGEKKAFKKAFVLAKSLQMLQALVTDDMMEVICQLQDNPLGFRTDKDPKQFDKNGKPNQPYPKAVVKSCFIEATLRGARPIGNEFNIIAARPYLTKEYFERKVKEFPGLSNFSSRPGVPHMGTDGALVPYSAAWLRNGQPEKLERTLRKDEKTNQVSDERIPVRVNAQMGADAILGKARRKFLAAVYGQLTGSEFLMLPEGEVDDREETTGGGTTASGFRRPSLPPASAPAATAVALPAIEAEVVPEEAVTWIQEIRMAKTLPELVEIKKRIFAEYPEAGHPVRSAVSQPYSEAHMELVDISKETR